MKRLFLPLGLLSQEKSGGKAAQQVAGLLRLKSWTLRCLCRLAWDHRLLLLGPHLGTDLTRARSQVSDERLAITCLHSQISWTSAPY